VFLFSKTIYLILIHVNILHWIFIKNLFSKHIEIPFDIIYNDKSIVQILESKYNLKVYGVWNNGEVSPFLLLADVSFFLDYAVRITGL